MPKGKNQKVDKNREVKKVKKSNCRLAEMSYD